MLNRRKLSPNPPAPTSTATSQNRGAADTVPVPEPAVQCAIVTSSDASVLRWKSSWLCLLVCSKLGEVVGQRIQDLVGGLGPGEWPGVVVPGDDPFPDVMFQGLHGGVHTTADQLVGEQPEPALDLVHPRRAGRGEVDVKAWMA